MYAKTKLVLYQDFQIAFKCITPYPVLCTFALRVLYIYFCIMLLFLVFNQFVAPRRSLERIGFPRLEELHQRLEIISKVRGYIKGKRLLQRLKVT